MSSYVAVLGTPTGETSCVFGLTPQEIRYLQSKFPEHLKHDPETWNPKHGIRLSCPCVVVLNALGFIGFKVVSTSGDRSEYLWTMERNLDSDTHFQRRFNSDDYDLSMSSSRRYNSYSYVDEVVADTGAASGCLAPPKEHNRRHSLTERLANVLHLQ